MEKLPELASTSRTLSYAGTKPRVITTDDLSFLKEWRRVCSPYDNVNDSILHDKITEVHDRILAEHHVFRCIASLRYLSPKCRQHISYPQILETARQKGSDFAILDVGACLGQESRALIVDGVPPSSIVVTDLHDGYWSAGKLLAFALYMCYCFKR